MPSVPLRSILFPAFLLVLLGAPLVRRAAAQAEPLREAQAAEFRVWPFSGAPLRGALQAVTAKQMTCAGKTLPLSAIWFMQGPASSLSGGGKVELRLHDGQSLVGDVLGGDEDGETLTLRSQSLGSLELALDDIRLLRVRGKSGFPELVRFQLDERRSADDTVFRMTALGLDPMSGVLDSVEAKGLRFERQGSKTEFIPWTRMAGLVLPASDEVPKPRSSSLSLLLVDGTRIVGRPVKLVGGAGGAKLTLEHERLGELHVDLAQILAGHVVDPASRVWLSRLEPVQREERGFFAKRPLYPFLRDRNVLGQALRVRRRYWTTGLGAHSLSRLDFVVPPGVKSFRSFVGADDASIQNRQVGDMRFRVLRGTEVLAEIVSVKGGQDAQALPRIPVKAGERIRLELDFGNALHTLDRGDWLAPVFER